MPVMTIILDGDNAWPDLASKEVIHVTDEIQVAGLSNGMASGKPSIAFRITLPNGWVVIAETSLALFQSAARAFTIRYGQQ